MSKKLDAIRDFTRIEFFYNTCCKKKKQENEAASNKRTTKRIIDIVARVLRNTRYAVLFLVENELAHVL